MSNSKKLAFAGISIGINIVLGTIVGWISIPLLFLDTVGTILSAVVLGPLYGMAVGGITNVVLGFIYNPKDIPFALVNIAIGLIVGLIAKKFRFDLKTAIITGLILAVVAPAIGTPIAIYVYGGITGDFNDVLFTALKNAGKDIFSAAFIPRITSNIIDKVVSCVLVAVSYNRLKGAINGQKKKKSCPRLSLHFKSKFSC